MRKKLFNLVAISQEEEAVFSIPDSERLCEIQLKMYG